MISLRPNGDTISVWNRNGTDTAQVSSIKEDLERIWRLEEGMRLDYEVFAELMQGGEGGKDEDKKDGRP